MSAEQENFEALRKLLAVKRYETPPPGYFDQFAGEVRARLRAGDHEKEDLWRVIGDEASWLQRLWGALSNRPAFAGACGMLLCGAVLTAGIHYSEVADTDVKNQSVAEALSVPGPAGTPAQLALGQTPAQNTISGTNPVISTPAPAGLFDQIPGQAREVNFSPAAGNQ